jgi:hypothetical protein
VGSQGGSIGVFCGAVARGICLPLAVVCGAGGPIPRGPLRQCRGGYISNNRSIFRIIHLNETNPCTI